MMRAAIITGQLFGLGIILGGALTMEQSWEWAAYLGAGIIMVGVLLRSFVDAGKYREDL